MLTELVDEVTLPRALRLVAFLLIFWEPLGFAIAAAGAVNAIEVRGIGVGLVLLARFVATAFCVAAGRAIQGRRSTGMRLALVALPLSAVVQLFAALTRYFPSNRLPGDTPFYVAILIAYYGSAIVYLGVTSRRPTDRDSS